jgi:hypothetical protein
MAEQNLTQKLLALQQQIDTARQEAAQADGALRELLKQIRTEFGCRDLKAAQQLLVKLKQDEAAARRKFERELTAFEKKWGRELETEE